MDDNPQRNPDPPVAGLDPSDPLDASILQKLRGPAPGPSAAQLDPADPVDASILQRLRGTPAPVPSGQALVRGSALEGLVDATRPPGVEPVSPVAPPQAPVSAGAETGMSANDLAFEGARIESEAKAIEEARAALGNESDQSAIAAFNERVSAFNERLGAARTAQDALQADAPRVPERGYLVDPIRQGVMQLGANQAAVEATRASETISRLEAQVAAAKRRGDRPLTISERIAGALSLEEAERGLAEQRARLEVAETDASRLYRRAGQVPALPEDASALRTFGDMALSSAPATGSAMVPTLAAGAAATLAAGPVVGATVAGAVGASQTKKLGEGETVGDLLAAEAEKQGVSLGDREALGELIADDDFRRDLIRKAEASGMTQAAVEGLLTGLGFGVAAKLGRAGSAVGKFGRATGAAALEGVGEGTGEGARLAVSGQEIDPAQVGAEALLGTVMGGGGVVATAPAAAASAVAPRLDFLGEGAVEQAFAEGVGPQRLAPDQTPETPEQASERRVMEAARLIDEAPEADRAELLQVAGEFYLDQEGAVPAPIRRRLLEARVAETVPDPATLDEAVGRTVEYNGYTGEVKREGDKLVVDAGNTILELPSTATPADLAFQQPGSDVQALLDLDDEVRGVEERTARPEAPQAEPQRPPVQLLGIAEPAPGRATRGFVFEGREYGFLPDLRPGEQGDPGFNLGPNGEIVSISLIDENGSTVTRRANTPRGKLLVDAAIEAYTSDALSTAAAEIAADRAEAASRVDMEVDAEIDAALQAEGANPELPGMDFGTAVDVQEEVYEGLTPEIEEAYLALDPATDAVPDPDG